MSAPAAPAGSAGHTPVLDPGRRFEAVIFDMDGLMIDSERLAIDAWQHAGRELGFPVGDEVCLRMIGRNDADSAAILVAEYGDAFPLQAIQERYEHLLDEAIAAGRITLKAGLLELLDFLDRIAMPCAVATSTVRVRAEAKLGGLGLLGRFVAVVSGDQVDRPKPAPDIFLEAARRLGAAPERCVVLEDSDTGVQAAHAAGMTPVMVPDIKPPSPESLQRAHRVFPSLVEVEAYLAEHLAR